MALSSNYCLVKPVRDSLAGSTGLSLLLVEPMAAASYVTCGGFLNPGCRVQKEKATERDDMQKDRAPDKGHVCELADVQH
jgi:hypothetical protein